MAAASTWMLMILVGALMTQNADLIDGVCVFFALTKPVEFVDSALLTLKRNRPPSFLHMYHHLATAITTRLLVDFDRQMSTRHGVMYTFMNLVVHSAMYSYFAAVCSGFNVPERVKRLLTLTQVLQMCIGVVVATHQVKCGLDDNDETRLGPAIMMLLLYISFVRLFTPLLFRR